MEFRQLSGVFGRYEVSKEGVLRRISDKRIIKGTIGKDKNNEYVHIRINTNNKSYHKRLHQLVMEAWGTPKPNGNFVIDHIDGNKLNNNINNLRWVTPSINIMNSEYYRNGTRSKKIEKYKFPKKQVVVNDILFNSYWEACKYIKNNIEIKQSVKNLCDRMHFRRKNIFGFNIKYIEKGGDVNEFCKQF